MKSMQYVAGRQHQLIKTKLWSYGVMVGEGGGREIEMARERGGEGGIEIEMARGGREGEKEREGGRKGGRERKREREGGREREKVWHSI